MYSTSIVESEMVGCFFEDHATVPPPSKNEYLEID